MLYVSVKTVLLVSLCSTVCLVTCQNHTGNVTSSEEGSGEGSALYSVGDRLSDDHEDESDIGAIFNETFAPVKVSTNEFDIPAYNNSAALVNGYVFKIFQLSGNCTPEMEAAVDTCNADISTEMERLQNRTHHQIDIIVNNMQFIANFSAGYPLDRNETMKLLREACAKKDAWKECVKSAVEGASCKPISYRVINAVLGVICTEDFELLLTQETDHDCIEKEFSESGALECMNSTVTDLFIGGGPAGNLGATFNENLCDMMEGTFDCIRQPLEKCNSKAGVVAEQMVSKIFGALFGEECVFEEKCEKQNRLSSNGPRRLGAYSPQCEDNGTFRQKQCHGSTGYCWCAHPKTGEEVQYTKTPPGVRFSCEGEFGKIWRSQKCSPQELSAAEQCGGLLKQSFSEFQELSSKFMSETIKVDQQQMKKALKTFATTCKSFGKFDACVANATQSESCKPYVQTVLGAVFNTVCRREFLGLLLKESECVKAIANNPETRKCQNKIQTTIAELQSDGIWESLEYPDLCIQVRSTLGCMKNAVKPKSCGRELLTQLDALAENTVKALFGQSCKSDNNLF